MSLSRIEKLITRAITMLEKEFTKFEESQDATPLTKQQQDYLIDSLRALVALKQSFKESEPDVGDLSKEEVDKLIQEELKKLHA